MGNKMFGAGMIQNPAKIIAQNTGVKFK